MYYDDCPRYPLCISRLLVSEGGYYITDDRFVSMSGIKIYCSKDQRKAIEDLFREAFDPLWLKAREYVSIRYGGCPQENDDMWPYHISSNEEYGVFIAVTSFVLEYGGGEYYDTHGFGENSFRATLDVIKEKYPDIKYYGYICDYYSDTSDSFWENLYLEYNISKAEKTYDYFGEYLNAAFNDKGFLKEFKRRMSEDLYDEEDFYEIIEFYHHLKKYMLQDTYIKAIDMVFDLAVRLDKKYLGKRFEESLTDNVSRYIKQLDDGVIVSRYDKEEELTESNDFERVFSTVKKEPDKYLTGIAPEAVSNAWKYEDDLDKSGYLPNEIHGSAAWELLPRVHKKAAEGDARAISIIKALGDLNNMYRP